MIEDNLGQRSTEYAEWYLTDADGNIFFSSDASQTGKMLDVSMLNREEKTSYQETKGSDQKSRIMVAYSLMDVNWFCVSVINTEAAQANVHKLVFPFLIISMIYILFLMVMLYIMQKYVFGPLRRLKHAMDQYALNGLEESKIEVYGEGEFSSLSRHFNNMTVRIKRLVKANQDETEEKNRQKMRALSAQLTPHFIYNALNTIKWVAVLNQQKKIQNLVESLIGIFMNAARADDDSYTLADELNLIENYSVIQKTRFMNFDLVINAEPDSKNCRIRKLLIQPIVENAIVHGLNRGKVKEETIEIRTWIDKNLNITVSDRGIGFDVSEWRKNPKKTMEHTNIGICNVEEIIRLEYGDEYGLNIESEPGKGTVVTYVLPVLRKEGEHDSDNNSGR
jgi:sensor histidine kinase YesM